MVKAVWNHHVLAESDRTEIVEGNHYFPPASINKAFFRPSERHTRCPWKGDASYYDLVAGDQVSKDAAWYYPAPKDAAKRIKNFVAFYPDKVSIHA